MLRLIIPFAVWTGDDADDDSGSADLYELNAGTRFDPGLTQPPHDSDTPPIRNSDAANLALDLLGLPAIPGSTINAKQDLRIEALADQ